MKTRISRTTNDTTPAAWPMNQERKFCCSVSASGSHSYSMPCCSNYVNSLPLCHVLPLSIPPHLSPIVMSAGELESGNAGEPAALIRQRYREASDIIKKGKMCCLFINDLDAGAGRMGGTTQYTVNNQMVNATLMNIADNPTNVQLPGM